MGFHRRELKRLARVRRLLGKQRDLLLRMQLEGITHITFHTTTGSLSLPSYGEAISACVFGYSEAFDEERRSFELSMQKLVGVLEQNLESKRLEKEFLKEAWQARQDGKPPIPYPGG